MSEYQPPPSEPLPPPPPQFVNCDVDKSKQVQMPLMIAPGNHARAWNDPPMLAAGTAKPSGVTKLNKRVAFPLSTPAANPGGYGMTMGAPAPMMMAAGQPQPQSFQPAPMTVYGGVPPVPQSYESYVLPPNQFVPTADVSFTPSQPYTPAQAPELYAGQTLPQFVGVGQESQYWNSVASPDENNEKDQIMNVLRRSVDESALEASQKEEVHKRLEMLTSNWAVVESGLKTQLSQLAAHIASKDYTEADRIQMLIGQEHMAQHSSWILAIRNVIRVLATTAAVQQQEQAVQS